MKQKKVTAICREVNKHTGEIASYLVKEGISDQEAFMMNLRSRANPELEYFATLMSPKDDAEDFEDALSLLRDHEVDYDVLKSIGVVKL